MPAKKINANKPPKRTEPLAPVTTDPRFSTVHSDPRFALPKRKDKTIAIDSRFKSILTDDAFARKARVDRYGRKLPVDNRREEVRRLYRFEDDEDEDDGDEEEEKERRKDESESESNDDEQEEGTRPRKYDPARGEGVLHNSDSTTDTSSEDDEEEVLESEAEEMEIIQQENDEIPLGDITSRIAVVNLDWDYITSTDLMVVLSSFLPVGGKILKISIYPSEFGKERMEREEMEGPPKELFGINTSIGGSPLKKKGKRKTGRNDDVEEEDNQEEITEQTYVKEDTGEEFDSASLRRYQLERLRYFYAIVEFDSPETANVIYTECDGAEFSTTANFFDLRFVPDGTVFNDYPPRDECTEIPKKYKPTEFTTDALQHSKVKLTWDQEDQTRKQVAKEAFSRRDIEDMDLKAYLASGSEDDEGEAKEAYRKLLNLAPALSGQEDVEKGGKGKKPVGDMEVTFSAALSGEIRDKNGNENIFEREETTLEKYARKEKERKKKRKEKMKANRNGEDVENDDHSDNDSNKNGEVEAEGEEDLGFDDPFFEDAEKVNMSLKKVAKAKKKEEKIQKAAELAAKREELEAALFNDDSDDDDGAKAKLEHFNMASIIKAEKLSKLKGKAAKIVRRKKKNRLLLGLDDSRNTSADNGINTISIQKNGTVKARSEGEGLQDSYKMDVADPRFSAIYERNEFAIDPTNPRFKKTRAMDEVMEERRKRRVGGSGLEGGKKKKKVRR